MQIFSRHTPIMIQQAFNTINMVTAFGFTFFFANHNVITANIKEHISMPVIGIVKASGFGMFGHERSITFKK
jgi:hypothetical protein